MAFQNGNKHGKGRPKVRDSLADAVRLKYPPEAVIGLIEKHLSSPDPGVAWKAVQFLAERAYGKAVQPVVDESDLTPEEFAEEVRIIGREYVESLPPEERFKLLSNTAPNDTVQ